MAKPYLKLFICLFSIVQLIGITACDSTSDCCTIIERSVFIHYVNENGQDLINSSPEYDASNIRIYYKNGMEYEFPFNENLDAPNMHSIIEDENGNKLVKLFLSDYYENDSSTTLIELNATTVDTIIGIFELDSNREVLQRAWFNGLEMNEYFITVTK